METLDETLVLWLRVSDDDAAAALRFATALGDELRQRVEDEVITPDTVANDRAIRRIQRDLGRLRDRYQYLQRKQKKTSVDRQEIMNLAGQISALQRDVGALAPASSASVRNRLEWLVRPAISEQEQPGERPPEAIPTREVMVAAGMIERGTTIGPDMLVFITVVMDPTNEMALTDPEVAIGRVAAIEILEDQPITPNMLADE